MGAAAAVLKNALHLNELSEGDPPACSLCKPRTRVRYGALVESNVGGKLPRPSPL